MNWSSLKLTLESPTEETVDVAAATIKTTGPRMANVTNGTHGVRVPPPSSSSTIRKSAARSASVTPVQDLSSGTRLDDVTECTHKDPVLTMRGSSPQETCPKYIVSAGMVSTSPPKTMFVAGP